MLSGGSAWARRTRPRARKTKRWNSSGAREGVAAEHRVAERAELGVHRGPGALLGDAAVAHPCSPETRDRPGIVPGVPLAPEPAVPECFPLLSAGEFAPH